MSVQHCILSTAEEAAELEAEKAATGMSKTDILLSRATKSGAWRATRARGITAKEVAAEDAARRFWFCGNPASPDDWPDLDHVLAEMAPNFGNRDFRAQLFAELALIRPDVVSAAYTIHQSGKGSPVPLVRAAFEEWFQAEPEAALDAFSVGDTARLLLAEVVGYGAHLAANNNQLGQLLECHYAESERSGVAGRRAHSRRVLGGMRERSEPWPEIEILPGGTPRIADNVRLKFKTEGGRRQPFFTTEPNDEPSAHVLTVAQATASGHRSAPINGAPRERPRTRSTIG